MYLCWLAVAVLVVVFTAPALAQDEPNDPVLPGPNMPEGPRLPGTVEGTGTYFEVTDSNYPNITLQSSEPVHLRMESVPEMVVMDINTAEGAASTQITMTGFEPSTTYYKYEDNYHNGVAFATDLNGSYIFTQDLTQPHLVFIQPEPGTIFLSDSGWSDTTVGTWDPSTKTGMLTRDVYETIQIDSDGINLDGAGHTVTGTGSGFGVYLPNRTGVTIKNINAERFRTGIYLYSSSNNSLTGNTSNSNHTYGIYLRYSVNNTLIQNTSNSNRYGIFLFYSPSNTLTGNITNSNGSYGIELVVCSDSTLTDNIASNNEHGIYLSRSGGSTLTGNTMSGNRCNFGVFAGSDSDLDNDIDTTNTVDGKSVYYVKNATDEVYDSSTAGDAGTLYFINCNNITIRNLTLTKNWIGVCLWRTHNSTIENVTAFSNYWRAISLLHSNSNTLRHNTTNSTYRFGIFLYYSSDNNLTRNTVSNNGYGISFEHSTNNTLIGNIASGNRDGVDLWTSAGNTLTDNTVSSNSRYGIYLDESSNNQIYNNNFIDNSNQQAYVYGGSGNVFNLDRPIGGNFWSDWTGPDADGDGFVDFPYVFDDGQDNLPLANPFVSNQPPVANAGGPYVEQATSWNGAYVDLDGTASSDPDWDPLAYEWDLDLSWDSDGDGDPTNDVDETEPTSTWSFPIGQTEISLVVIDDQGLKSEPDVTSVTVSVIDVSIDIKPGSFPNSINMGSNGVVPVAFLTDPDFDASTIDPATVTLRGEDFTDGLVKLRGKKDAPVPMSNLEDIDGDGDLDLIVHLVTEKLAEYELEAMCELGALTYNGYVVSGSDVIHVVPE